MNDTTIKEGRYLYCAVSIPDQKPDFSVTGVDDEPTTLIPIDDVGVVVHECNNLYDTDEVDLLRKWLLQHQQVVDAVGERFGTPLPFRFDTIIQGNDDRVREWAYEEADALSRYLDTLSGLWEYHIDVMIEDNELEAGLEERDERLQELTTRINDSGSGDGTNFLLEKQYNQRLATLKRRRRDERARTLRNRLSDITYEIHDRDTGERSINLTDSKGDESDRMTSQLTRLTLLAHENREKEIGDILDDVAAEPGVTVRFTGPWPPYTFTPAIGDELESEHATD
ncbi:gas vesicle protein GvpL [Halocatena pleomorpha]|uniref:GvpL/GvpF family gas vesicle protein n=1 Tax=Halocatena pleomorpha TaxID=1785090 RepID=A0A3P3R7Z5_9EURY|nr:GvpL/GvpF family gas vesicle protein [Halocatena pleomorpha]RRJ29546.1 GvpL/GvpF family gas vesicle protein [Halocatena pleomorpha]